MKKVLILFLIGILFIPNVSVFASRIPDDIESTNEIVTTNQDTSLIPNARSGMLVEASTGKILFQKNPDEKVAVASMTKMMSQILILEAVESGNLSWDEKITVSSNAAGMGGSQIWLEPNEVMSVKDLMKGISMASANDATVALAERIAGTESAFVDRMNQKASEMQLRNTQFKNATGLDEEGHYSSARDMATIALELLHHEEILNFSSVYEDYLRQGTETPFWLVNTNKLVRTYIGADGLKTGHTDAALYCMAVTAKRDNLRLVAIVLGEENSKVRNKETASLLDSGFNQYQIKLLHKKGDVVGTIKIDWGNKDSVEVVTNEDIGVVMKKGEEIGNVETELQIDEYSLPLEEGDYLGMIILKRGGEVVGEYPVTVKERVDKIGFLPLYLRVLEGMLTGNNK